MEKRRDVAASEAAAKAAKIPLPNTFRRVLAEHLALQDPITQSALPLLAKVSDTPESEVTTRHVYRGP